MNPSGWTEVNAPRALAKAERRRIIRRLADKGKTAPEIEIALQLEGYDVGLRCIQQDIKATGGGKDGRNPGTTRYKRHLKRTMERAARRQAGGEAVRSACAGETHVPGDLDVHLWRVRRR